MCPQSSTSLLADRSPRTVEKRRRGNHKNSKGLKGHLGQRKVLRGDRVADSGEVRRRTEISQSLFQPDVTSHSGTRGVGSVVVSSPRRGRGGLVSVPYPKVPTVEQTRVTTTTSTSEVGPETRTSDSTVPGRRSFGRDRRNRRR